MLAPHQALPIPNHMPQHDYEADMVGRDIENEDKMNLISGD